VIDSGSGVPAESIARVFEPFFTTKSTGMGMGLSISRTIIEAHGGRIWAENNVAGGATFAFALPATEAERQRAHPHAA
jgi:two-component system sensor kinase FixL